MPAFTSAVEDWGVEMLELDVRATRDGEIVVLHDATVDRTTDGSGPVVEMTWAEVGQLDAGFRFRDLDGAYSWRGKGVRVPRLEEVLRELSRTRIIVEVKSADAAPGVVEIVHRLGAQDRVLMATAEAAARARHHAYRGPSSASARQIRAFILLHATPLGPLYTPWTDAFQLPFHWKGRQVVTPTAVAQAHARNMPVHVWTVDDPDEMRILLSWGVDGILTDRPDILVEVMHDLTGRPPPERSEGDEGLD